jgi:UDP-2-acetamido-2,6-beta-L-arabino-hexul-4-ose reductase
MTTARIAVTGGDGFIGRNLRVRLQEAGYNDILSIDVDTSDADRRSALAAADFVIHLAGVNRAKDVLDFDTGNRDFTATLCSELRATGRKVRVAYTSSTQALLDNPYGVSKRAGELEVQRYAVDTGSAVYLFRLTNVFGKWCRPNYNSVVATFCYNLARGLPISVNDPSSPLSLVYVDDVVEALIGLIREPAAPGGEMEIHPTYVSTVGEVATMLREFVDSRSTGLTARVGTGFTRVLYATYVSYLPPEAFGYSLTRRTDPRGMFAEILKTPDCGQISFFTAYPGVTRGGHYHHSKSEKFLVAKGRARFRFRHLMTGELYEILVSGDEARVVETVPGWVHDVTNVGEEEMIVLLWANEIFDPEKPDTIAAHVLG